MKIKTYFRGSLSFWGLILICSILPISAICVLLLSRNLKMYEIILLLICCVWVSLEIFSMIKFKICFKENNLIVKSSGIYTNEKIQKELQIEYSDILSISLLKSKNDSCDKPIKNKLRLNTLVYKNYINLTTTKGCVNRIYVTYFSKRQIIKIVEEIKYRCSTVGNDNLINVNSKILLDEFFNHKG